MLGMSRELSSDIRTVCTKKPQESGRSPAGRFVVWKLKFKRAWNSADPNV